MSCDKNDIYEIKYSDAAVMMHQKLVAASLF